MGISEKREIEREREIQFGDLTGCHAIGGIRRRLSTDGLQLTCRRAFRVLGHVVVATTID